MRFEKDFQLLIEAAIKGVRCPQTQPHGPLANGAMTELIRAGKIKSEVYRHNFRVVTILAGEHRGKSTAPAEKGLKPYRVNGVYVGRFAQRYGHPARI